MPVVTENLKRVEDKLNVSGSDEIFENVSEETLKVAGEMFLYLNSCPKNIMKSEIRKSFEDYISNENVQNILIFLNRIVIKTNGNDETVKDPALAMLNKIHDLKELNFKKLEVISTSSSKNVSTIEEIANIKEGLYLNETWWNIEYLDIQRI